MTPELQPASDLSLQHVIENSLAIIEREPYDEEQRRQVLTSLTEILDQASKGSEVVQSNLLALGAEEQPAFERFALLFHYLQPLTPDVPGLLTRARSNLEELKDHQSQTDENRAETLGVLRLLLQAVITDRCLKPLISPREFIFS
ncbi:hypothetical protein ABIF68_001640 [Bradyrhizobium japonicum]